MATTVFSGRTWRRALLVVAIVTIILLIPAGLIRYWMWSFTDHLRAQRQLLLDAFATPQAQSGLLVWSKQVLGQPRQSFRQVVDNWPPPSIEQSLSAAGISYPEPIMDDQNRVTSIMFFCGGADNHYGLVVGLQDPPECYFTPKFEIASGIWYFDELPRPPVHPPTIRPAP